MNCEAEVLLKALEDIYKILRTVRYGSFGAAPYAIGQAKATAEIALRKAMGETYPCPTPLAFDDEH